MTPLRTLTLAGLLSLPVSVAFTTMAAPPAQADDKAEGRRRFKEGQSLFRQGRYLEAAHEFEAGFAAAPRPLFLLNIGHSYRRAQEFRKAKRAYERLLQLEPTTPYRAEVESLIRTIDDALLGVGPITAPKVAAAAPPPAPAADPGPQPAAAPERPLTPAPAPVTPPMPPASPPPAVATAVADADADPLVTPGGLADEEPPSFVSGRVPPAPTDDPAGGSMLRSPWLWAAVGVVVVGVAGAVILSLRNDPGCGADLCFNENQRLR